VEAGHLQGPATEALLRHYLAPIQQAGADTIVLACSHYPFVIDTLRQIAGPGVAVIDPSPAIARHLGNVLLQHGLQRVGSAPGKHAFVTTGDPAGFAAALRRLTGVRAGTAAVRWRSGSLVPR
jgi:glutamate racemase